MIFTVLVWLYITVVAFCIGNSFHHLARKAFGIGNGNQDSFSVICISGLLLITVIVTALCVFIPLGLLSNAILFFLAALGLVFDRKNFLASVRWQLQSLRNCNKLLAVAFVFFVFIMAYWSYEASSHYDDGLYYSTSIKWLQEYGTVKGLANINPRIAFNSAWLIVQANFGFQFLKAGLFNDLNGLIYLYVLLYSLQGIGRVFRKDFSTATLLQAIFFLPVLIFHLTPDSDFILYNTNMISSPSADMPVCILTWQIFLLFIQKKDTVQGRVSLEELMIIFYSAVLVCIKLSAIPIFIFSVVILLRLLRKAYFKQAALIVCSGFLVILPWLARNVLLSGWLVFPFSGVNLFPVDWKIPVRHVHKFENLVKNFAVDPSVDGTQPFKQSLREWLPGWFGRLVYINQVILLLFASATMVFILIGLVHITRRNYSFFRRYTREILFIITSVAGVGFWLFEAPDPRFGYGFLCIYGSFSLVLFMKYFLENQFRFLAPTVTLLIFISIYHYLNMLGESFVDHLGKHPIPYRQPETLFTDTMNNGRIVNIVKHEDSWNAPLPVANSTDFYDIRPVTRGATIQSGFRSNNLKDIQQP